MKKIFIPVVSIILLSGCASAEKVASRDPQSVRSPAQTDSQDSQSAAPSAKCDQNAVKMAEENEQQAQSKFQGGLITQLDFLNVQTKTYEVKGCAGDLTKIELCTDLVPIRKKIFELLQNRFNSSAASEIDVLIAQAKTYEVNACAGQITKADFCAGIIPIRTKISQLTQNRFNADTATKADVAQAASVLEAAKNTCGITSP